MKTGKTKNTSGFHFSNLALNDYESVYVIDAIDDSYVEYSASDSDTQLVVHGYGDNFFLDVAENLRSQVWEEDKSYFIRAFSKTAIMESLRGGKSYSIRFRLDIGGTPLHYAVKTIRSSDHSIILGIMNVEEQLQRERASEAERITYMEIAEALAGLFAVLYQVDLTTGSFTVYHSAGSSVSPGLPRNGEDFFGAVKEEFPKILHPVDCSIVLQMLERDTLLADLEKSPTVTLSYRQLISGQTHYVKLLAFRRSNTEKLVIGIQNVDAQRKLESSGQTYTRITGALASRYEAIYYIDILTNSYIQYCTNEEYKRFDASIQGNDFFAACQTNIPKYLHPDDADQILMEIQKASLLRNLNLSGTVMLTYRQILSGREQYVSALIVRPKDDPHHIVMAVMDIDAQIRREMAVMTERRTFGDVASSLAQRYDAVYHVDVASDHYTEYSSNTKYKRLKDSTKGTNFFADMQQYLKSEIFAEDYPMMIQEMKKENLLEHLRESGKYFLNYRMMLDGSPQYVTMFAARPKEDSSHLIFALTSVDTVRRMEGDLQTSVGTAMDIDNRDPLTGVKNKRAYANAEAELNQKITDKNNPDFAIVVCDINSLKSVNEAQGHDMGDEYICSACHIICDTFKHSPVFRVGGDEFAVLLKGNDYDHRKQLMQKLSIISLEHSQTGKVTLASGIADFDRMRDQRVQDVFERADAAMFENKKRFRSAFRK